MIRTALTALLVVAVPLGAAFASRTDLPVTGTVVAVVSGTEIDVIATRSSIEETVAAGTIVRVVYHGLTPPGRFDPLYMEALDLNWNLVNDSELFLDVAEAPWDDEQRLHAYVYLDPSGYGMVNAFVLASGLAVIDPALSVQDRHGALLRDVAAAAKLNRLGVSA